MKKLTLTDLENITGGDEAAANTYLQELRKKYGGKSPLETLARAKKKEANHWLDLMLDQE